MYDFPGVVIPVQEDEQEESKLTDEATGGDEAKVAQEEVKDTEQEVKDTGSEEPEHEVKVFAKHSGELQPADKSDAEKKVGLSG